MIPEQACDCHVHVVGDPAHYPMLPSRPYTAGLATVGDLRAHLARIGFQRAVIIQPSFYGTDNRCLLDALHEMEGDARGIAVLDLSVSDAELARMDEEGVRGIRLNLESHGLGAGADLQGTLERWAQRIADLGWHLQVYAAWSVIQSCLPWLGALPVPVVIDHFGLVPVAGEESTRAEQQLARALAGGNLYVKLSGSYRVPGTTPEGMIRLARSLVGANVDNVVWASDWPHTNREQGKAPTEVSAFRHVDPQGLLTEIADWLPDDDAARKVLRDNPERLYRF
jgi:predicted TIM-barrel fold metal-dependent hydrolase